MSHPGRHVLAFALAALFAVSARAGEPAALRTRNVVLVTTDGLRWQEVFRGAEAALLPANAAAPARRDFWRDDSEERRAALLPFVWRVIARDGQLYGNADKGSLAHVANGKNFSYPGYNELLAGWPDPRIDSNAKRPNPNITVLEWLQGKPAYKGRVAAFGSWDVFPFILNRERSGLLVDAGWEPTGERNPHERNVLVGDAATDTARRWPDVRYDSLTMQAALEHLKRDRPRVLYVALGETDEYAHEGHYDQYLQAAHRVDRDLERLWQTLQSLAEYRASTTLIVTTDHGRGDGPEGWKNHGVGVAGSERIWIAVLGPDTPPRGERTGVETVTQGQVAATLAALLGENYGPAAPRAGRPIGDAVSPRSAAGP